MTPISEQKLPNLLFSVAEQSDVPSVLELLAEGGLNDPAPLSISEAIRQFDQMSSIGTNTLYVGILDGDIIACYQLALIYGVSVSAGCRAQIEGVRVASSHRGAGIGTRLMADAERRARQAGAQLIQLMSNQARIDTHRFYRRLGYTPSHTGFKKGLSG